MASWNQRLRGIIGSQLGADVVEFNIEKAIEEASIAARTSVQPISQFYDPYSMFFGREWLAKAGTSLTFNDLRQMAKSPIIGSIIQTRLNQVAAFCHPSNGSYEAGYEVTSLVDKSPAGDPRNAELSKFIQTAGFSGYGDSSFEEFARKTIRDSLVMDQCCGEIVLRNNGKPAYMVAVDGATIRRLQASQMYSNKKDPVYAQVIDEVVVAEYQREQMMYGIRNPNTDIRLNGYGSSELEMLITIVTTLANAEKYNATSLAQGGTQKGILVVKGQVDKPQMDGFKREFREAVQNAAQNWRPPVLNIGPDASVDWVALDRSNKDMEYAQLFEFIVKLATGVYQISPEEVNWQVGAAGASVTYNSGVEHRLSYSQDKGLRPLLQFLSSQINTNIISKLDDTRAMRFTGLGTSKSEEVDLRAKEGSSFKTLNEVREEANLPRVEGGDVVLNPVFAQLMKPAPEKSNTPTQPVEMKIPGEKKPTPEDTGINQDLKKTMVFVDWGGDGGD